MAEPSSSSGCLTSFLLLLAAISGSFMAAFNTASSVSIAPPEIVTYVGLAPVGSFSADDLEQAAAVIRSRLKGLGLFTATVTRSGDTGIEVGLPPINHLDDVLKTLAARGLLEFVDFATVPESSTWVGRDILTTGQGDRGVSTGRAVHPVTGKPFETILTGAGVESAIPAQSAASGDSCQVTVRFKDAAGIIFENYTRTHIGTALAIVWDGKVLSVPVIQAVIRSGAVIAGTFTEDACTQLAVQVGSGALPFEMQVRAIRSTAGISVSTAVPSAHP